MKVRLKRGWWSGRRWRPGIHTMPDTLFDSIPSSAEVATKDGWKMRSSLSKLPAEARGAGPSEAADPAPAPTKLEPMSLGEFRKASES